jgi:predicted RNA-binding Zn-ribbon protein involved in translation (DUF1610 family)
MAQRTRTSDFFSGILVALRRTFERVMGRTEVPREDLAESNVICSSCGSRRPRELAEGAPRTPCPKCGSTAITVSHQLYDEIRVSATVEASLRPGDQARGWKRRWTETERDLAELLRPHLADCSSDAIHAARHRLHSFFIHAYHLKDALREEVASTGVAKAAVERAITNEPALALLADLANLDKHGNLNQPPRSGHVPLIVGAAGTSLSDKAGWRLDLEIRHDGNRLDGLQVAEDAVAAWRRVLTGWGLL